MERSRSGGPDPNASLLVPSVPARPSHLKLKDKETLIKEKAEEDSKKPSLSRSLSLAGKKSYRISRDCSDSESNPVEPQRNSLNERNRQSSTRTPSTSFQARTSLSISLRSSSGLKTPSVGSVSTEEDNRALNQKPNVELADETGAKVQIPTSMTYTEDLDSLAAGSSSPKAQTQTQTQTQPRTKGTGSPFSRNRPSRSKTSSLFLGRSKDVLNKFKLRSSLSLDVNTTDLNPPRDSCSESLWLERSPAVLTLREWEVIQPAESSGDEMIDISKSKGYRLELGTKFGIDALFIEELEKELSFYQHYFLGQEHQNFISEDSDYPAIVSVEMTKGKEQKVFKTIVRTKERDERYDITGSTTKERLKSLKQEATHLANVKLVRCSDPELEKGLNSLEQQLLNSEYKFGILFAKEGQTEDEMFANREEDTGPDFEEFLTFLGDKIPLLGWPKFRGGLDNRKNTTGMHSIYTAYNEFEIMFHVSTFLPFFPNDKQQVERKRHLGNDVVVIIYYVGKKPFCCETLTSNFNQVYIVIQPILGGSVTKYKIALAAKSGVRPIRPFLPNPPIFKRDDGFRAFLLTKLINSERVSMYAPEFFSKMTRTRATLLSQLIEKHKQ